MSSVDTSTRAERESDDEPSRTVANRGREYLSTVAPSLRRGVEPRTATAIVGGTSLLAGLRAFRRGNRGRGLAGVVVGAALLATALARQRRSGSRGAETDAEERDVVDTGADAEDVGSGLEPASESAPRPESDTGAESAAADQREVDDTETVAEEIERKTGDIGDTDGTTDGAATDARGTGEVAAEGVEPEEIERLGEAALDRQSREVPVPQQAFNRGFLSHSAEAFWGIRADDDAVVVSQNYDAIQSRDGMRYVASTQIGEDVRELPIPDTVLDHWDEVAGGGTAVAGGDDILFVTTDDLSADGLLRVLPSKWADDIDESG